MTSKNHRDRRDREDGWCRVLEKSAHASAMKSR
jgi:hypothetical protein